MSQEFPDTETIKAFNNSIADEFRANDGKVGGQFEGADLLLLTTTGAKSGQPRVSPLAYFRIDGKLLIIGSFAGVRRQPGLGAQPAGEPGGARRDRQRLLGRHRAGIALRPNVTNFSARSPRPPRVSPSIRRRPRG